MRIQGFIVYRIYYSTESSTDTLVYVGRTKQPLQDRIRGHLFAKPMQRTIDIAQVSKIEYAELTTEADMNLYEIYYILKNKPPLNVDDKTKDALTVSLPELHWLPFQTDLWDKWTQELEEKANEYDKLRRRLNDMPQELRVLRSKWKMGELTEDEYYDRMEAIKQEEQEIRNKLYKC